MRVFAVLVTLVLASVAALLVVSLLNPAEHSEGTATVFSLPDDVRNPVVAAEPELIGFRQVLPRDAILPVYEPQFVSAAAAGWGDESLVIGLELDGESRAYPVGFLNRREMVIDSVAGIPVLVTW